MARIVIIGAGIVGLSVARAALKKGHEAIILEQGPIPNPHAASFDLHRMIRYQYGSAEGYTRMVTSAFDAWDRLWDDLGTDHFENTGSIAISLTPNDYAEKSLKTFQAIGLDHEELFVKNLENVQGDERDIIIVSVAYGPGATGRMIMNFGPINQEGGEKRLNVIFSRAKHHVAVVASFDPSQIANDWNKGAKALKRYLMYAAAVSTGDTAAQTAAVAGYPGADRVAQAGQVADPLADVIAETYRAEGRTVARGLGQSTARCDIALRPAGAAAFTTAILTDNAGHYAIADMIDRYVTYPGLLRAAGWSVEFALAKDWLGRIPRKDESPIGGTATRRAVPGASTSGRRGDPSSHSPTLDAGPLDANLGSKDGA